MEEGEAGVNSAPTLKNSIFDHSDLGTVGKVMKNYSKENQNLKKKMHFENWGYKFTRMSGWCQTWELDWSLNLGKVWGITYHKSSMSLNVFKCKKSGPYEPLSVGFHLHDFTALLSSYFASSLRKLYFLKWVSYKVETF